MKKSLNQQCLNEQEFKLKYPEYIKFLHPVCRNSNGYTWVEEIKTRCKELDEFYQDEHRTMERFKLVLSAFVYYWQEHRISRQSRTFK